MARPYGTFCKKYTDEYGKPIGVFEWRKRNLRHQRIAVQVKKDTFNYICKTAEKLNIDHDNFIRMLIRLWIKKRKEEGENAIH